MPPRDQQRAAFLRAHNWARASGSQLAGDASGRLYWRLSKPTTKTQKQTAILMDADPAINDPQTSFIEISRYLNTAGLSAPKIFASNITHGFLLLEDFGDALFSNVIAKAPEKETLLYTCAVDCLLELRQKQPASGRQQATPQVLAAMTAPAFDWYGKNANAELTAQHKITSIAHLQKFLERHAAECSVTILRDFHANNLIWLPQRQGLQRVGLLDFQDAMIGHPAYDLVSLTRDARRDLTPEIADKITSRYLASSDLDPDDFSAASAVLSVQRNLRILGVFTQLAIEAGKLQYLELLPRVWQHLLQDLAHPALADYASLITAKLPPPDPTIRTLMRATCPKPRQH